eukprot:8894074-Pyramimonas_sp.AAC.1
MTLTVSFALERGGGRSPLRCAQLSAPIADRDLELLAFLLVHLGPRQFDIVQPAPVCHEAAQHLLSPIACPSCQTLWPSRRG